MRDRGSALAWEKSVIDLGQQKQCIVNSTLYDTFSGRITNENATERLDDTEKRSAFDSLCSLLNEHDECQYSLGELEDRMNEEGKTTYSRKRLKEKRLARHFHHNRFS